MNELHKKVGTSSAAERARSRRKSEKHVKTNFEVGDYLLVGTTQFGTQAKTAPRCIGPFRVVAALSQWMYTVEHISTKKRQEVHANALRLYHDPSLNVELSVEEQLALDEARVYEVEEIEDVEKREEKWMLRVKWKDFDEKTWKEARQLHQDAPGLINTYMNEKMAESKRGLLHKYLLF